MCNSLVLFISSVKKVYIESTETKSILIRLLSFLRVLIPQRLLFFLSSQLPQTQQGHRAFTRSFYSCKPNRFSVYLNKLTSHSAFLSICIHRRDVQSRAGFLSPNCNDFSVLRNNMLYPVAELFLVKFRKKKKKRVCERKRAGLCVYNFACMRACTACAALNNPCIPKLKNSTRLSSASARLPVNFGRSSPSECRARFSIKLDGWSMTRLLNVSLHWQAPISPH